MSKKHILFVLPSMRMGGLEKQQVTMANSLCGLGYDVTVLIYEKDATLASELDKRVRFIQRDLPEPFGKKIPYIRYKLYDEDTWLYRYSPRKLYKEYIGNKNYDIEIAFFRGLPVKIISGSTNKNAVHLAWVHSDFRHAHGYKRFFDTVEQAHDAYATFDSVICVSKQAEVGFKKIIGDTGNTTSIYNLIPTEDIRKKSERPAPLHIRRAALHLVIVARLDNKTKGQIRLIDAVSRLHDEGRDLSLAIIGAGPDESEIRSRIQERQAESYIEMLGQQPNPYSYIHAADVLVCASSFEGYNLTVAEALVLGTPVISTDCSGPSEILGGGKYGMLVENSAEGLYNGLKELCDHPELVAEYREKAIERQSFFDDDKIVEQIKLHLRDN